MRNFDENSSQAERLDAKDATISRLTADNEALRKELDESRAAHHRTSHKAVKRLRALWREKQAAESRVSALSAEVERLKAGGSLADALQQYPLGTTFKIEHDGFEGQVCGYYERRDGKRGVVLQQIGTRVVHVYGEKWLRASLNGGSDHG